MSPLFLSLLSVHAQSKRFDLTEDERADVVLHVARDWAGRNIKARKSRPSLPCCMVPCSGVRVNVLESGGYLVRRSVR